MYVLDRLFGNPLRAKLIRFFILNPVLPVTFADIARRTHIPASRVAREMPRLRTIGLVRRGKKDTWILHERFPHREALRAFIHAVPPLSFEEIAKRIVSTGRVRLIVLSGVFSEAPESPVDVLVVGDGMKMKTFESTVRTIESLFGHEIRYALFTSTDYRYRKSINDRLLRNTFDYPHHVIFERAG
jgi:hypothetical protein